METNQHNLSQGSNNNGSSSPQVMPNVLFREIHKNAWLKRHSSDRRTGFPRKSERVWVVFCVHDDVDAYLELYTDQKTALTHKPDWFTALNSTLHVSPSICGQDDEFEFAITLSSQVIRLAAPTWDLMMEWVETVRNKLRELKVLSPRENLYSKLPEQRLPLLPTRDPNSPLPLPPLGPSTLVPGVEPVHTDVLSETASTEPDLSRNQVETSRNSALGRSESLRSPHEIISSANIAEIIRNKRGITQRDIHSGRSNNTNSNEQITADTSTECVARSRVRLNRAVSVPDCPVPVSSSLVNNTTDEDENNVTVIEVSSSSRGSHSATECGVFDFPSSSHDTDDSEVFITPTKQQQDSYYEHVFVPTTVSNVNSVQLTNVSQVSIVAVPSSSAEPPSSPNLNISVEVQTKLEKINSTGLIPRVQSKNRIQKTQTSDISTETASPAQTKNMSPSDTRKSVLAIRPNVSTSSPSSSSPSSSSSSSAVVPVYSQVIKNNNLAGNKHPAPSPRLPKKVIPLLNQSKEEIGLSTIKPEVLPRTTSMNQSSIVQLPKNVEVIPNSSSSHSKVSKSVEVITSSSPSTSKDLAVGIKSVAVITNSSPSTSQDVFVYGENVEVVNNSSPSTTKVQGGKIVEVTTNLTPLNLKDRPIAVCNKNVDIITNSNPSTSKDVSVSGKNVEVVNNSSPSTTKVQAAISKSVDVISNPSPSTSKVQVIQKCRNSEIKNVNASTSKLESTQPSKSVDATCPVKNLEEKKQSPVSRSKMNSPKVRKDVKTAQTNGNNNVNNNNNNIDIDPQPVGSVNVQDIPLIGGHQRRRRRSSSSDTNVVQGSCNNRGATAADRIRVNVVPLSVGLPVQPEIVLSSQRSDRRNRLNVSPRVEQNVNNQCQLTLREQQVMQLRKEMMHPGGVRLQLRRKDCMVSIALVDVLGSVWIAGWKQKERPMLYNALHIGDQLVSVAEVPVHNANDAQKLIRSSTTLYIEFVIKRIPFGKVYALRRSTEGEQLGVVQEGNTAEIRDIIPNSIAARAGLSSKTQTSDGLSLTNWYLTEINGRPLNLFFKDNEIRDRLNAVGKEISILVQPHDFIKNLKKHLKNIRGYKDYIVQ